MARTSWFDDKAEHPDDSGAGRASWSRSRARWPTAWCRKQELGGQEQRLVAAMKTLEPELSDELHAKVTTVLVELTAYNVMRLLHELQAERARMAFGKA